MSNAPTPLQRRYLPRARSYDRENFNIGSRGPGGTAQTIPGDSKAVGFDLAVALDPKPTPVRLRNFGRLALRSSSVGHSERTVLVLARSIDAFSRYLAQRPIRKNFDCVERWRWICTGHAGVGLQNRRYLGTTVRHNSETSNISSVDYSEGVVKIRRESEGVGLASLLLWTPDQRRRGRRIR